MPRVLLVIDSLVPGGAERSTVALLPLLAARGFELEVAVLHGDRAGLQHEARSAGAGVHDLSGSGQRLGWVRRLRALIAERQPDLVHTSLFEADVTGRVAAASQRVPVVSTLATEHYGPAHLAVHGRGSRRVKLRAAQGADAATARLTRRLHAVSAHVADTMAAHLRYPRDRIDVVYRGRPASLAAEPPAGTRQEVRASLDVADRYVVLMLARHESAKGIDRMIEAFGAVRAVDDRAVLLVAGRDGQQSGALRDQARRLCGDTGAIRFLGHRDDIGDLLAAADLFALPSRREGLPGSLLEAMASGTPAVACDLPQVREVVPDGEAELVDAADPAALAAAVNGLMADPGRAVAMATRARQRFLGAFTLDRAADGMAAFYHGSLAKG